MRLHGRSFNSGSVHAPSCYQLGRGWKRLLHAKFSFVALRGFHFGVVILYADRHHHHEHHHGHHPLPHPFSSCITFHLLRGCCWPGPFGYQCYSPVWFLDALNQDDPRLRLLDENQELEPVFLTPFQPDLAPRMLGLSFLSFGPFLHILEL